MFLSSTTFSVTRKVVLDLSGCRIPVVRTLRVRVDWVQFPAARLNVGEGSIERTSANVQD